MRQSGSIALFRYWNALRGSRSAPSHSAVEPADIRTLLADTFILERDSRGDASFRLAGTRLCAIHGRELKSFCFSSLWQTRDQRLSVQLASAVFATHSVVLIHHRGLSERGRSVSFELLLLPLDGPGTAPRCLGISTATETPFWLGSDPLVSCEIETVRIIDPAVEAKLMGERMTVAPPPLAPDSITLPGTSPGARRVRHLLVLDGGRQDAI